MTRKRFKIDADAQIYVHNDLANAAYHFKKRIEQSHSTGNREGITLDMMACIVTMSFAIEARINFLGHRLMQDWAEFKPLKEKIKAVAKHLGVSADFGRRPYKSVKSIKHFRDLLAHGKPEIIRTTEIVVATDEEIESINILRAEWEDYINLSFIQQAYSDCDEIWEKFLKLAGLNVFDTMTRGGRTIQFIEKMEAQEVNRSSVPQPATSKE